MDGIVMLRALGEQKLVPSWMMIYNAGSSGVVNLDRCSRLGRTTLSKFET